MGVFRMDFCFLEFVIDRVERDSAATVNSRPQIIVGRT